VSATLLVLAGFAIVGALLAWSRWLAGRRWAAAGHIALATAAALIVAAGWPISRDLAALHALRPNQAVAELFFEQVAARRFRATLTRLPSGRMQVFELEGDEWRLTARGLDWTPRFAALGLGPRYQLERLEARVAMNGDEPAGPTRFILHPAADTDLWSRLGDGSRWSAAARPLTLAGPWQPMAHRQRYVVRLDGTTSLSVAPGRAAVAEQSGASR
jgi:hypothetical protein